MDEKESNIKKVLIADNTDLNIMLLEGDVDLDSTFDYLQQDTKYSEDSIVYLKLKGFDYPVPVRNNIKIVESMDDYYGIEYIVGMCNHTNQIEGMWMVS